MTALVLLAAVAGGTLATYLYDDESPLPARVAAGAPLGLVLLGLSGFVAASWMGLHGPAVAIAVAGALGPGAVALLRRRAPVAADARVALDVLAGRLLHPDRWTAALTLLGAVAAWTLWRVFDRAMFVTPDAGIATGVDHNLGDLPFHVAVITSFLHGENFPPEHPELAGVRLTYPFLVDFVSALLMRAGASLRDALFLVNAILALSLAALLFRWASHLTRDRLAAAATPLLVFLSGGLGFRLLARDVNPLTGGLLGLLPKLTHDYTILPSGELRWGNLVITMLMTQRSILLGMPIVVAVWTLWWQALREDQDPVRGRRMMAGAGVLTGLLPLVHSHAFAVTVAVAIALALLTRQVRSFAASLGVALALALPQLVWLMSDTALQTGKFVAWHLGWDRGTRAPTVFWLDNLGLFIPLLVVGLVWGVGRWLPRRIVSFYVPFLFCFIVPNVLQLSPWIWDNIKFLVWWHVASAPIVALLLARLWRTGGWPRVAGCVSFLLLTLSGGLDVWRVASRSIEHVLYDGASVAFADRLRAVTLPGSIVLHAPAYNSEVYLAGRRSVIGYPGHPWSQGLDAGTREEDVRDVYRGAEDAAALLARYRVDYALLGPREMEMRGVHYPLFERYRLVAESTRHRLYAVR